MSNDPGNDRPDLRAQLVEVLLAHVERDRFPSATMMDLIEESLTGDETARYAEILMDRIREDVYPSVSMMRRLRALADRQSGSLSG